jgi:hypothetical protein
MSNNRDRWIAINERLEAQHPEWSKSKLLEATEEEWMAGEADICEHWETLRKRKIEEGF